MTAFALPRAGSRLTAGLVLALATTAIAAPIAAQAYARVIANDLSRCAASEGPAVRAEITGLKSAQGHLFVRIYKARSEDWLKSKRYLARVDAAPRKGAVIVCIPLPEAGDYAIAAQHDVNGNRETDFAIDGAGMSNNPQIKTILGIPRPPSVSQARFRADGGVTRLTIEVRYRD